MIILLELFQRILYLLFIFQSTFYLFELLRFNEFYYTTVYLICQRFFTKFLKYFFTIFTLKKCKKLKPFFNYFYSHFGFFSTINIYFIIKIKHRCEFLYSPLTTVPILSRLFIIVNTKF